MFEYDNGILVCKEHGTPAQKDSEGLWCPKCQKIENDKHDNHEHDTYGSEFED